MPQKRSWVRVELVAVVLVLAVVAALAARALRHRWDAEFRDEVQTDVTLELLFHGFDPQHVEALGACVAASFERDVPERQMREVMAGRDTLPPGLVNAALRHCACDVVKDPAALAAPGYCGAR